MRRKELSEGAVNSMAYMVDSGWDRSAAYTTRRVTLTEAGARFLARTQDAIAVLMEAQTEAAEAATGEPSGTLRLALPGTFGRRWIAPYLSEFLTRYPRIRIHAEFSNRFVDLIGEGFDAAVRVGVLSDSSLR